MMEDISFMEDLRVVAALGNLKNTLDHVAGEFGMTRMKSLFILGETAAGNHSLAAHVGCACTACAMNAIAGIVEMAAEAADDPVANIPDNSPRGKVSH
jgi:hypothetical protein